MACTPSGVYALGIPGGWVADRVIGKKRAVLYGGIVIAAGHYVLAIHNQTTFFVGLLLVVIGTGLLKPNVSAIVGDLYPEGGARRDAGFSIFYSGINIGAFLGQIICPLLGEKYDWHLGFGAAAIGMTLGVVQYVYGQRYLQGVGDLAPEVVAQKDQGVRLLMTGVVAFAAILSALVFLTVTDTISLVRLSQYTGQVVAVLCVAYFGWVIGFVCRDRAERGRVAVIALLFLGAAVFWAGFEQAGSSMNLFARDFTDRVMFGWELPAGWLQNVNAFLIIFLAPVVGQLWVTLGARNPSIPAKFALGLALLGVGFLVLAWGSAGVEAGKVGMRWLVVTYFFHSVGELCLSPVGLSSVTKLSPNRLVGQMMGTWFMGAALGNLIAGMVAGKMESMPLPSLFGAVALSGFAFAVVFVVAIPLVRRLVGELR